MSTIDALDYDFTPKTKFRNIKCRPRWVRLERRQADYEDHRATCELVGDEPFPKNMQGHISAAKLKGSPEYKEKVAKMTDRRERIKTHEPARFETNIRPCGCCTDITHFTEYCFFCGEYGDVQELRWLTNPKPPKRRIRDMPSPPLVLSNTRKWYPRIFKDIATPTCIEPTVWPRVGQHQRFLFENY
jgi:hypothetical protein